ncbi:hypothetical protein BCV73_10720 [Paenibacillus sp. SSG-1]|nr:hypothetical protein BCV73_10720 [Paenibacillus sp. SSG-1]
MNTRDGQVYWLSLAHSGYLDQSKKSAEARENKNGEQQRSVETSCNCPYMDPISRLSIERFDEQAQRVVLEALFFASFCDMKTMVLFLLRNVPAC